MDKTSGIYCIENIVNGKKYIGCAVDIRRRITRHFGELKKNIHSNSYLQRAYNKYGKSSFIDYIVQELPNEHDLLEDMEVYWIAYYNSYITDGGGYNNTRGGGGCLGSDPWNKGICIPEEMRNNIAKALIGNKYREGTRQPEGWGERQSAKMQGKKMGKNPSSQYVGVCWDKSRNLWSARINYMMKHIHIGRFKIEKEAAQAYNKKAIELYGEGARINTIEED